MTQLIAFTGHKGSGKDTAAAALDGYENVKMAGGLKAMLAAFLAYQGVGAMSIDRILEGDLKETPCPYLGGRTPRHAMQTLGTEWGRDLISPGLWVEATERRVHLFDKVVISDVRFPNEAAMVKRLGGILYRIVRPNGAGLDQHQSETEIDLLQVDAEIINDAPNAESFSGRIRANLTPWKHFFGVDLG